MQIISKKHNTRKLNYVSKKIIALSYDRGKKYYLRYIEKNYRK